MASFWMLVARDLGCVAAHDTLRLTPSRVSKPVAWLLLAVARVKLRESVASIVMRSSCSTAELIAASAKPTSMYASTSLMETMLLHSRKAVLRVCSCPVVTSMALRSINHAAMVAHGHLDRVAGGYGKGQQGPSGNHTSWAAL
ncbi:hypothetical protein HaLaN_06054 [Haematococcus lacustris]|uniref:Secreted protein n=1 Tax=Haematococcus lacustris TaxID=44745 RepID=A0A699YN03_HAELA|nr:hypothetical protein HaLaN_06054 [Haematococcus lacustris]